MDNLQYLQSTIDPKYYGGLMIFIGMIVAALRFATSEPIEK